MFFRFLLFLSFLLLSISLLRARSCAVRCFFVVCADGLLLGRKSHSKYFGRFWGGFLLSWHRLLTKWKRPSPNLIGPAPEDLRRLACVSVVDDAVVKYVDFTSSGLVTV